MPEVEAHITGTVWKIEVEVGDSVEEGDTVVILESMKMEMPVEAEDPGVVTEILCEEGQSVSEGDTLVVLDWAQPPPREAVAAGLDEPAPGVTRLTISNPDKRGALDHAILDAFTSTMPRLDARCVIITGEETTFSAGYDIGDLADSETFADEAERLVAHPFTDALDAIEAYPYPTIAALNGHAIGGGLELALSCDLRIAAGDDRARDAAGEARARLLAHRDRQVHRHVGAARTRELFLVGRRIDARTARSWGLVNAVAEPGHLAEEALDSPSRSPATPRSPSSATSA